ncbi:MAG: hypothetical protein ACP5O7_01720 [Phycisphaerae bacterium]
MNRRIASHLAAFALYAVAACALFLPAVHFDLAHYWIGSRSSDPAIFIWSLQWWPWALTHHINPLYCRFIWAPAGQTMLWVTSVPAVSLLCWPLTSLFGPVVVYNLVALSSPVLGAFCAYLLCREVTQRFWPAVLGGVIFGFSTFEFVHLRAHLDLFVIFQLPLAVWLYLLRRRGKLSSGWYVTLISALAIFQFGVFVEVLASATLFGLAAIACACLTNREHEARAAHTRGLKETLLALVVAGAALSPLLIAMFAGERPHGKIFSSVFFAAEPLNFFIPTRITWLGGHFFRGLTMQFAGQNYERAAYFGLPLLLIAVFFIREFYSKAAARTLILIGAIVTVAPLGGQLQALRMHLHIALPWLMFDHLPLLQKALPVRFLAYAWLVVAVMAAWWAAESATPRWAKWSLAAASLLFIFPNLPGKFWSHPLGVPAFYSNGSLQRYISPGENVVVLPYGYIGYGMLYQAEEHFYFRMAGGYLGMLVPPPFTNDPVPAGFFEGDVSLVPHWRRKLRRFVGSNKVGAFIQTLPDIWDRPTLLTALHVKPIITGGVALYLVPRPWLKNSPELRHKPPAAINR